LRGKAPSWINRPAPLARGEILQLIANLSARAFKDHDPLVRETIHLCVGAPLDTMHLAMWPITVRLTTHPGEPVPDELPVSRQIAGVEAQAFDMHTREGREAIRRFHLELSAIYAYAPIMRRISTHKAIRALGSVLFVVEGGLIDVRFRACWLDALRELQDTSFCSAWGVPPDLVKEVTAIVRHELPRLHDIREQVMFGRGDPA
jgi:hypothetical protein